MKKIVTAIMTVLICSCLIAGCGKKDAAQESTPQTPAWILLTQFKDDIASDGDIEKAAEKLIENPCLSEISMVTMAVEEGYLNGFQSEIKGFNKGVMFSPMIGSIPFVGYIFETEDAEALTSALKASADLRWNICTEADEMVCEAVGNYVFFCMAPEAL